MPEPVCPSCGEAEALQGRPAGDDIAITCQQCGAEWRRGEPRCKCCGRAGSTTLTQRMTRHPRGTLLAVVGVRQIPLCGRCDAAAIAAALQGRRPVAEGYVSRFLFGEVVDRPAETPSVKPRSPTPRSPNTSLKPVVAPRPTQPPPDPVLTDPTLRQATKAFLNDAGEPTDGLTMVLLGTKLGASTRLSRLDTAAAVADLSVWLEQTYTARPDQRSQAVATLRRAFAHWRAQGWLTHDLAAGME